MQRRRQSWTQVEKSGSARATKPFASGGGQSVDIELGDVDAHLPHGLAGVEQYQGTVSVGEICDSASGIDQTAVGGCVHHRDQLHAIVEHGRQRVDVDPPRVVARNHLDDRSGDLGAVEGGDRVAGVFGLAQQDSITRGERHRVEEVGPGTRRGVTQCDARRRSPDQRSDRCLHRGEVVRSFGCGPVATDFRFPAQVRDGGVDDDGRRQRGAGAVEEDPTRRTGGVAANAVLIEHGRPSCHELSASGLHNR